MRKMLVLILAEMLLLCACSGQAGMPESGLGITMAELGFVND